MSMKANELTSKDLMIDDLVMLSNGLIYQIDELNGYQDGSLGVTPIPITKEILEKNGFERENRITSYNHYIGIDNRVSLNDDFYCMNSRNMWTAHIDSEDYCTVAHCELTYLHELQHLLRLCNIDFEFVV